MARAFAEIAFTPSVKAAQTRYGSRRNNQGFEQAEDREDELTETEADSSSKNVTASTGNGQRDGLALRSISRRARGVPQSARREDDRVRGLPEATSST